jgi:hypothetical protein
MRYRNLPSCCGPAKTWWLALLHRARRRPVASALVEELADSLPAFRDAVLYDGKTLTLHRKAQAST